ncbi:hypothetical protein K440DRAFT_101524 [Wilcoxina mikolae CBS 423.85]|nr:hypothetical protein K440DRAFT_101524 [Wilcoxina mikolae CBS 423.85]
MSEPQYQPEPAMSEPQQQSEPQPAVAESTPSESHRSIRTHFSSLASAPLVAHLTDSTGHAILSTAESSRQTNNLQQLSLAYLSAHDTASRMGLGVPLRVTLATRNGSVAIQTGTEVEGGTTGEMVVGTIVAPEERMAEARVASWGVEEVAVRVGRVIGEGRKGRA